MSEPKGPDQDLMWALIKATTQPVNKATVDPDIISGQVFIFDTFPSIHDPVSASTARAVGGAVTGAVEEAVGLRPERDRSRGWRQGL